MLFCWRLNLLLVVLLAYWMLFLSGCNKASSNIEASLPVSWPLPQLTLPDDATQEIVGVKGGLALMDEYVVDGLELGPQEGKSVTLWVVGFDSRWSWERIKKHVAAPLTGEGFTVAEDFEDTGGSIKEKGFSMDSKDGLIRVELFYKSDPAGEDYPAFKGYSLSIMKVDSQSEE